MSFATKPWQRWGYAGSLVVTPETFSVLAEGKLVLALWFCGNTEEGISKIQY